MIRRNKICRVVKIVVQCRWYLLFPLQQFDYGEVKYLNKIVTFSIIALELNEHCLRIRLLDRLKSWPIDFILFEGAWPAMLLGLSPI